MYDLLRHRDSLAFNLADDLACPGSGTLADCASASTLSTLGPLPCIEKSSRCMQCGPLSLFKPRGSVCCCRIPVDDRGCVQIDQRTDEQVCDWASAQEHCILASVPSVPTKMPANAHRISEDGGEMETRGERRCVGALQFTTASGRLSAVE